MKLFAVILMGILAYAAGDPEYLTFKISSIYDSKVNAWIPIEKNGNKAISEVNVLQPITGDDWTLQYSITVDQKKSPDTVIKLCDTAETIQDANAIELFMNTLGLQGQDCPIQPQTVEDPENTFGGYLELENYNEDQWIHVDMMLMKNAQPLLLIVLTT